MALAAGSPRENGGAFLPDEKRDARRKRKKLLALFNRISYYT